MAEVTHVLIKLIIVPQYPQILYTFIVLCLALICFQFRHINYINSCSQLFFMMCKKNQIKSKKLKVKKLVKRDKDMKDNKIFHKDMNSKINDENEFGEAFDDAVH